MRGFCRSGWAWRIGPGSQRNDTLTKKILSNSGNTFVFAFFLQGLQLFADQVGQQFLSLDLRDSQFIGVIPAEELLSNKFWQFREAFLGPDRHLEKGFLLTPCLDLIKFSLDASEGGQEGGQALRDEDTAKVTTSLIPTHHHSDDIVDDLVQIPAAVLDLLADDGVVGLGGEGALEGEVGRVSAHQSDEVPVLGVGRSVNHQVTDEGRVGMRGCGKPGGDLEVLVVHVVVDRAGHTVDHRLYAFLQEVVGEQGTVSEGVAGTHQDQSVKVEFPAGGGSLGEFFVRPDLVAAPAEKVEASLVDVVGDQLLRDDDVVLVEDSLVASHEAKHFGVLAQQSVDDVVAAGGLPAVETHTDPHLLRFSAFPLAEGDDLVAALRQEGILSLNGNLDLLRLELQLLTEDESRIAVEGGRVFHWIFQHCGSERVKITAVDDGERSLLRHVILVLLLLLDGDVELVERGRDSEVGLGLVELVLRGGHQVEEVAQSPQVALGSIEVEERTVEIHQRLLDHGHALSLTGLDVHHGHKRIPSGQPVLRRLLQVSHAAHEAGVAGLDDGAGVEAEGVAVVAVEGGGEGTPALVAEVVGERGELPLVVATLPQLLLHQVDDQLLCLDLGHLDVAVRVAVQQELASDLSGQEVEECLGRLAELIVNKGLDLFRVASESGHDFIDFRDELVHLGDELDESLRDKHHSVVLVDGGPADDDLDEGGDQFLQGLLLGLDLLADEGVGGPGGEGALEGDVGGRPAHQPDEVVVLLRGQGVGHDRPDALRVGLAGSVVTETHLHELVLQIAVYRLRAPHHANIRPLGQEVLGEEGSVGVGVVAADDDQAVELERLAVFEGLLELVGFFNLIAARAYHIEAAPVLEVVHVALVDLHVLAREDALGTVEEAEQLRVLVHSLDVVVKSHDHVVPAGRLSARQHAPHPQRPHDRLALLARPEVHCPHPPLGSLREDGGNVGVDGGLHFHALQHQLLQHLGRARVVLGTVLVEG